MMKQVKAQLETKLDSLVFPLCEELGEPEYIIKTFIHYLEKGKSEISEVHLTTKDPKYFDLCMSDFRKCIVEMLDNNDICFE